MQLIDARNLANELMREHGLTSQGWCFRFDRSKTLLGRCWYERKEISLSESITLLNPEASIRDTILHEIAHAIAGFHAHHGPEWKAIARRIGARPERCGSPDTKVAEGKYVGLCPRCEHRTPFYRKVKRSYVCSPCKKQGYTRVLTIVDNVGSVRTSGVLV